MRPLLKQTLHFTWGTEICYYIYVISENCSDKKHQNYFEEQTRKAIIDAVKGTNLHNTRKM